MTDQEIVQKYKNKVYTQEGMLNIRTLTSIVKQIIPEIGKWPVHVSPTGTVYINYEILDNGGYSPEEEINYIIRFCKWLKGKYYTD